MANYYRNRNSDNGGHRRSKINWGGIIAIVLAGVLLCTATVSGLAFLSDGFTKTDPTTWFEKELNPDNLITKEMYAEEFPEKLQDANKGDLEFNIKDDGTIVLKGKYYDEDELSSHNEQWVLTQVTVPAGEYVLSMGNTKHNDEGLFGLVAEIGANEAEYIGAKELTFSVDEETLITVSVYVNNDNRFYGVNSYIRPILVPSDAAVEYYK